MAPQPSLAPVESRAESGLVLPSIVQAVRAALAQRPVQCRAVSEPLA